VLVVGFACLAVLTAVSLRDSLVQTRSNQLLSAAQAISSWVQAAHQARLTGASLEPDRCSSAHHQPLSFCFADMVSPGQPFAGLTNSLAQTPNAPAFAFVANTRDVAGGQLCDTLSGPVFVSAPQGPSRRPLENWAGLIIIQPGSFMDDLSVSVNRLNIGYCDQDGRLVWVSRSLAF